MKQVHVNASHAYDVLIGRGLLEKTGAYCAEVIKPCKAAVITDDRVDALYSEAVSESLRAGGFDTVKYVFPNGEASKNIRTYAEILEFLAASQLTRSDLIVALGGGVVGDMAGFAAATYLRGIAFVQIPTTFLAAIDSSVGGKTAIDLAAGKNLAGAFYQPRLVLCDCDTLDTLTDEIFADGAAEAIKYGVLAETKLFETFASGDVKAEIEDIICECVSIKRDVVAEDEFDRGKRQLLNLGHTVGHGIEKLSHFSITHGHAVAAGMAIISRTAVREGLMQAADAERLAAVLRRNALPASCAFSAEALAKAALSDKKRSGSSITLIVPERIGACRLMKVETKELPRLIAEGEPQRGE